MDKANQRIKILQHDLAKARAKPADDDDDDDDDEDLNPFEALQVEMDELVKANEARQAKLDAYEKNKKWNVDNLCQVKEERTVVNPNAPKSNFTPTGFAQPTIDPSEVLQATTTRAESAASVPTSEESTSKPAAMATSSTTTTDKKPAVASSTKPAAPTSAASVGPAKEPHVFDTYHIFTEKYADIVEEFMSMPDFEHSKEFLLLHGDILLQENASNYLLLASLEDEMNGYRDKMKQTCRQSQIISHIAELAKSLDAHPGNVIVPFFEKLKQKEFLKGFIEAVDSFVNKIIARAIVKKAEIDRERGDGDTAEGVDLASIPKEERLGPGGLDPLEVIETLPVEMQQAFESRDVDKLKQVLLDMDPEDAARHMKRCVDSGLWVDNSNE
jgi:cell division cycle protein 37